jgi:hypothetical protein
MQLFITQLPTASCHFFCLWFKQFPQPSVLKQPPSINILITVFLNTLNPCPSLNVRYHVSIGNKQQVKQKYFIPSSFSSWTGDKKKNRRLRNKWQQKSCNLTKIQIGYYSLAESKAKLLIIIQPTHTHTHTHIYIYITPQDNKTHKYTLWQFGKRNVISHHIVTEGLSTNAQY